MCNNGHDFRIYISFLNSHKSEIKKDNPKKKQERTFRHLYGNSTANQMANRHMKMLNTISKEGNANYNYNALYVISHIRRTNF